MRRPSIALIALFLAFAPIAAADEYFPPGGPTGSAGGDLSGSFPNPTVAKVNGAAVPNSGLMKGNGSGGLVAATAGTDYAAANASTVVGGQTCALGSTCGLSSLSNSIASNVTLNNTSNYFDGPSVAQGTTGTWFASGSVTLEDSAGAASYYCKLWDGTTVIDSGGTTAPTAGYLAHIALSGVLASPAANIKISCRDISSTSGALEASTTSNSKDSTVTVLRIQ